MHTDATTAVEPARPRMNGSNCASWTSVRSSAPGPPGTMSASSGGTSATWWVGRTRRPPWHRTSALGPIVMTSTYGIPAGSREPTHTSNGPAKSRTSTSSKSRMPTSGRTRETRIGSFMVVIVGVPQGIRSSSHGP